MKKNVTKHALLTSVISLLLCVSMLVGTTFAWFTDSVTSGNNIIKSGNLDVEMYWANGTEAVPTEDNGWTDASTGAIFNYDLWEPGYTEVRHIKIANKGSLALKYQVSIVANGAVSDLSDVIDVYYVDPAVQVSDRAALVNTPKLGTLTEVLAKLGETGYGELIAGEAHTITLAFKMQESAGNEYMKKSIGTDFSVVLMATQLAYEEDSFNNEYDENAEHAVNVSNAAQLQDALSAGKSVTLINDIDLTSAAWTPAGATVATAYSGVIDGQGHKIIGLSNGGSGSDAFGLIAYGTGNVTVKNIVFEGVNIQNGREYSAAVMGLYVADTSDAVATYAVNFENIAVNGSINASDKAAAVLGCNYRSSYPVKNKSITFTFDGCVNNADISGASRNGGIAGAVSGEFTADGNNSEIKVVFNNCVNNGTVASTSATYKTGAIVGFASGTMNYEFNNCVNNGTADGDLLGRVHTSMIVFAPTPSSSETFQYLDFTPMTLTSYDMGKNTQVVVTYRWNYAVQQNLYDTGNYYVGNVLADDEWRITIDGTHYRLPFNVPVDGVTDAGVVEDTVHNMNPTNVDAHWTNSEYNCVQNGYVGSNGYIYYEFHKDTDGK